jgi:hypothetical protein
MKCENYKLCTIKHAYRKQEIHTKVGKPKGKRPAGRMRHKWGILKYEDVK